MQQTQQEETQNPTSRSIDTPSIFLISTKNQAKNNKGKKKKSLKTTTQKWGGNPLSGWKRGGISPYLEGARENRQVTIKEKLTPIWKELYKEKLSLDNTRKREDRSNFSVISLQGHEQ